MARGYADYYDEYYLVTIQFEKSDLTYSYATHCFLKGQVPAFIQSEKNL